MIMNKIKKVAYLGPEGTYSHIISKKHFSGNVEMIGMPSIIDVCDFAAESPGHRGLVPVENSSGGPIAETIDILLYNTHKLAIEESMRLCVQLALLGNKGENIEKIYSHSVPLFHCREWLREKFPNAVKIPVSSTAQAAKMAKDEKNVAAIGSLDSALLYELDVLRHPIVQDIPNQTQFYTLCQKPDIPLRGKVKTSIVGFVANTPGSLYDFLEPFKLCRVNMSRIISRPIYGKPTEYAFYVDIDGGQDIPGFEEAVMRISKACSTFRIISSYPENILYNI